MILRSDFHPVFPEMSLGELGVIHYTSKSFLRMRGEYDL